MKFYKLKAGALQLTLFICVVVALLLLAFIIMVQSHERFKVQTDFVVETVNNANNGINYSLMHSLKSNDTIVINLQDEDYKSLKVHKGYWGIYQKIIASSKIKNYSFQKAAFVGAKQQEIERVALYVEDKNKPLVVVGNTRIKGLAYLPQRGVKSGNISGHSYYGEQLIYGTTKTSDELPKLSKELLEKLDVIPKTYQVLEQNQFLDINNENSVNVSFYRPSQILFCHGEIDLSLISLTGNIIVQSQTKIIVQETSKLKDVILIAPEVEIMDNVKGSFQVFASKSIVVGVNCSLTYPSALVLNAKENDLQPPLEQKPLIRFGKNSTMKGMLVFFGKGNPNYHMPQIIIEDGATVVGEVYCNSNLELKGNIKGSVFTSNFVANQSGSIYQNHIYNGTITIEGLPREYIGLEFEDSNEEVMKWLY